MRLIDNFYSHAKRAENGCLEWQHSLHSAGYGQVWNGKKIAVTHRVSWELTHGPIPDGMCVCHKCDNHLCVDPEHLFLGTMKDNHDDMKSKGRSPRGERHGLTRLTEEDVFYIRTAVASGHTQTALALLFDHSKDAISCMCAGETWGHAPGPIKPKRARSQRDVVCA